MYPWMKKKTDLNASVIMKFVKIFFIQIYIKFAETKFDQTIKLVWLIWNDCKLTFTDVITLVIINVLFLRWYAMLSVY